MSWTILLFIVPSLLIGGYLVLAGWRRHRTPPDLRGDWWSRFESEFRAYAERNSTAWPCPKAPDQTKAPRPRPQSPPP
jgi:hypothetical protein